MRSALTRRVIALTIALFLVTVLARFAEYYWALELLTHFTWHYFLAGLLFALLLLGLKKTGWAISAVGLSLFQLTLIIDYQGVAAASCTGKNEGEELTILQFNIGSRNEKAGAIYAWLTMHRPLPDIVVLFEATEKIDQYVKYMEISQWPYVLTEYRSDNFGIALLSSIDNASLALETIGDPYLPSVVVKGTTDLKKIPFTLVATHPPPPLTGELAETRNQQFTALAKWLRRDRVSNQIVVGDLNVSPWSPWFSRLLSDAELRSAQNGKGYAGTFPTYGLPSFFAIPIDHTLISPKIKSLGREVGPGFTLGSDHRLVETRLLLSSCEKSI